MAHSLHLKVLAEGVETQGQLALLVENRCDQIQGFLFSKPVVASEIEAMVREGRCLSPDMIGHQSTPRTLLLVDDEPSISASLRRLLRRDGYKIVMANSGPEGLQRLAENDVDVIVSDQRMPGMTGVEFLRRAKELYPDTVRIVLSGYTELQYITDAVNEGAIYKFLTKPWDDELLREQIAEAFRRKELADDNRRLDIQVKQANRDLAEVNNKLQSALDSQREQITRDEARIDMAREVLECIPIPVLGIDVEGVVAFVNAQAERIIAPASVLIGELADEVLPAQLRNRSGGAPVNMVLDDKAYQALYRDITSDEGVRGQLLVLLPA
jgi:CheY-like chemotaxis protein